MYTDIHLSINFVVPDEIPASDGESFLIKRNVKKKKQEAYDIDFTKALDKEISDIFAPPRSRRSILLPPNRGSCSITLPEDCHYQAQNLVKLLLRPDVLVSHGAADSWIPASVWC